MCGGPVWATVGGATGCGILQEEVEGMVALDGRVRAHEAQKHWVLTLIGC